MIFLGYYRGSTLEYYYNYLLGPVISINSTMGKDLVFSFDVDVIATGDSTGNNFTNGNREILNGHSKGTNIHFYIMYKFGNVGKDPFAPL